MQSPLVSINPHTYATWYKLQLIENQGWWLKTKERVFVADKALGQTTCKGYPAPLPARRGTCKRPVVYPHFGIAMRMAFISSNAQALRSRRRSSFTPLTACEQCVYRRILSPHRRLFTRMAAAETEADPVASRVRRELADRGVNLDELLNAAKVVDLTRKLDQIDVQLNDSSLDVQQRKKLDARKEKIEKVLVVEKRLVMQQWLKRLFLAQAIAFAVLGGLLASDSLPGVQSVPLVAQALGFWMVWLFTIPALRARKGIRKSEKSALNVSFLIMPFVNVALPVLTRNCALIWSADIVVLVGSYVWYDFISSASGSAEASQQKGAPSEKAKIKGILKYLDWGSWR